uniref:Uncharacterized protein MANES_16G115400 n=1 Tax=Rhizophora mucronata TaxID=61149 RepID=A0A2P2K3R1_RHIMU
MNFLLSAKILSRSLENLNFPLHMFLPVYNMVLILLNNISYYTRFCFLLQWLHT